MSLGLQAARPSGGFTTRFCLEESSASSSQFPVSPGRSRSHGCSDQVGHGTAKHDVHKDMKPCESVKFEDGGNCCSHLALPITSLSASCPLEQVCYKPHL